jgi:carbon monoxide dehydrogenase subunit G
MIVETVQIDIARPIGEVFEFLTDVRNHPLWDASSVEMEPDQPGPWRAGLGFREVRRIGPRRVAVRSRIVALEAPTSMDLESLTGPSFTGQWRLSDHDGGTRLRWTGRMQLFGPHRLLQPLIARSFRRASTSNFARLKSHLETNMPTPERTERLRPSGGPQ